MFNSPEVRVGACFGQRFATFGSLSPDGYLLLFIMLFAMMFHTRGNKWHADK